MLILIEVRILGDFNTNADRFEKIRRGLGWEAVAVLRNRKKAFFFGRSDMDSFGPTTYNFEY